MRKISKGKIKVLDLGCGSDKSNWYPGADTCEINPDDVKVNYYNTEEIPSSAYDKIHYSFGYREYGNNDKDKRHAVEEINRITKPDAEVEFVDWMTEINWDSGNEVPIPKEKYMEKLKRIWKEWDFESVKFTDGVAHIIMKKRS